MFRPPTAAIVTGLSAVCVLALAGLGRQLMREPACATQSETQPMRAPVLETRDIAGGERLVDAGEAWLRHERAPIAQEFVAAACDTPRPGTEAWYRAQFLVTAEHEEGGLEHAARRVLAGKWPDCEKVAVLRALCDARSAQASEILATAVEDLPDISGPQGESVPRCALRFLAERAAQDAHARSALMRLAWSSGKPIASGTRATAAAAVAVVASGAEAWQIVRWLQVEHDPLVHAAALEALSRNRDPDAAAAFRSIGVDVAVPVGRDRED